MRSGMVRVRRITQFYGTCHPHVYPRIGLTITLLPLLCMHSPDGATRARQCTECTSDYNLQLIYRLEGMKSYVCLVGWSRSGPFTYISGHPSAAGRPQDREILPATERFSTTVPRNQPLSIGLYSDENISPGPTHMILEPFVYQSVNQFH